MWELFAWFMRPIMRAWVATVEIGLSGVPRPHDEPRAVAAGPDSDQVLLFGTGPSVGWGVLSHDLALAGALARAVSALTGRGAEIDVIADPRMPMGDTVERLSATELWRYDAIVLTLGFNEAVRLISLRSWRDQLQSLLVFIFDAGATGTRVFVLGVQPVRRVEPFDAPFGSIAARHAKHMNAITVSVCQSFTRATYVRFAPPRSESPGRHRTPRDYRQWAGIIAGEMAPVLDEPGAR
ncbi:MAG: diguanylate cyclase [Microbacteriaceae bacterium]|nr:diguanylate cyclase [Microbacteriaceae bacterium]